jgi:hypothetical protein
MTTTELQELQTEAFTMTPTLFSMFDKVADMLANGGTAVPEHLRGKKGACFALALQSHRWQMDPFAVAQKTHITKSGQLGYDGQLIAAVVIARAPIRQRPEYEYIGDWSKVLGKVEERKSDKTEGKYYVATYTKADEAGLGVIVSATFRGEDKPRTVQVMMAQAYPRFSTQWATDPQQQIGYLAIRKWSRRHAPDVLLGVYAPEEMDYDAPGPRNMGPVDEVPQRSATSGTSAGTSRTASVKDRMKKNTPAAPTLDDVLRQIAEASNAEELAAAGEQATKLRTEREKEIARTAYTDRLNAARAATQAAKQGSEKSAGEDEPVTYAVVMDALEKSETLDVLDVAADLIRGVQHEAQREELEEFYVAKRAKLTEA